MFAFFTVLTFTLMVQKQIWEKKEKAKVGKRQWDQAVLVVTIF